MKMMDISCHISTIGIRGRQTSLYLTQRISQKVREPYLAIGSHLNLYLSLPLILPTSSLLRTLSLTLPLHACQPSTSYHHSFPPSLPSPSYSLIVNTFWQDTWSFISAFSLPSSHNACLCLLAFYRFTGPIYKSRLSVALPAGLHGTYADGLTFEQDDIIQVLWEAFTVRFLLLNCHS